MAEEQKEDKSQKKKQLEEKLKQQKGEKKSYFNKKLMFFSLIVMAVGVIHYFKWLPIPDLALDIVLLLAGLWLFKLGLGGGFYSRRKEIFKRYL